MIGNSLFLSLGTLLQYHPQGWAVVKGSVSYPGVSGLVRFYQTAFGVLVAAEFTGLPVAGGACQNSIFAFHIHEGSSCTGNEKDPFANVGLHYNPQNCKHPYHAGDLVPLFGAGGYAFSAFLTDRFEVRDVIGRTVVVHHSLDDFTSQPAGNAGEKIACGVIIGRER